MSDIIIRAAQRTDIRCIAAIEAACFPAAEAATEHQFSERFAAFGSRFLVAEHSGQLIGFINGCATNSLILHDELYHDASQHEDSAENQTVFGLDVLPDFQRRGIAALLMKRFIELARANGHRRILLTCKQPLFGYYEKFGYQNDGPSASTHGGAQWFDMHLPL